MIRCQELSKYYGQVTAVEKVSFRIHAGEIFACLGPNGAGKTTIVRLLTGLSRMDGGEAWVGGKSIRTQSNEARMMSGLVPQHFNMDQELTLQENLDIHGRYFGMNRKARHNAIGAVIESLDLQDKLHHPAGRLSGGQKRRAMIARALLHGPQVLFLDEPTVGLDPIIRRRLWGLVKDIASQGTTVFLTTHLMDEAETLAHRVAFLSRGRLQALDSTKALISGLGNWALEFTQEGRLQSMCFQDRVSAEKHASSLPLPLTIRPVNLEDAYLRYTGQQLRGTNAGCPPSSTSHGSCPAGHGSTGRTHS